MMQPRCNSDDFVLDPYCMACPTFGCRGDCHVCDPDRKVQAGKLTVEGLDIGSSVEMTEDGCPIWSSCQQKRARFMKKPLWIRLFGLTAITTALVALQAYGRQVMETVRMI